MKLRTIIGLFFAALLSFPVYALDNSNQGYQPQPDPRDPFESLNRKVFSFNETMDKYFLRPVAVAYKKVTPTFLNRGITNFYDNISEVETFFNSLLQWKGREAANSAARFMFNSTFGLLGFFDVGSSFGLPRNDEDFGQTLGYWGVPSGPYIVVPFIGPHTVRRLAGRLVDGQYFDADRFITTSLESYLIFNGIKAVDLRASLLSGESFVVGDKYTFVRNGYLQRREYLTKDGQVDDPFSDGSGDNLDNIKF
jgi:phospholipid-binding lipoprotein MlaA